MDISINGNSLTITEGESIKDFILPLSPSPKVIVENGFVKLVVNPLETFKDTIENTTISGVEPDDEADARTKLRNLFPDAGGATGGTTPNLDQVLGEDNSASEDIEFTSSSKGVILKGSSHSYRVTIDDSDGDPRLTLTQL